MKVPARFRLFYYLFFFLFALLFPYQASASEIVFSDDFTSINSTFWNAIENPGGSVNILDNDFLRLSATNSNYFPYVYLQNVGFPESNYSIELRFKLSGALNYGSGIVFSDKLLTNGMTRDLSASDVIFQIWPISSTQIGVWTTLCKNDQIGCTNGSYTMLTSVPIETWNSILIHETSDHYVVSINGINFETRDSSRKITNIWAGNPERTNNPVTRATVLLDIFRLTSENNVRKPIIFLPGIGASWNVPAIKNNLPSIDWTIPPFVQNYNSLIKSLENAGYEKNKDLFVFAYDWRKPLDVLATDLQNFIHDKNLDNEKIGFVGHSMGGLVARAYANKYGTGNIDKIVAAGTPNLGTPIAYGTWEGGEVWKDNFWQAKLAVELLGLNNLPGENKIDTIRRVVPSIKDLLPTYDFLSFDGVLKPWNLLNQKNAYLGGLNQSADLLNEKLTAIVGVGQATANTLNVQERSIFDGLAGLWEDGKPTDQNSVQTSDGDDTVTAVSAGGSFDHKLTVQGTHYPLLSYNPGIEAVFDTLGLDKSKIEILPMDEKYKTDKVFTAVLKSPGRLEVCNTGNVCDSNLGIYYPEDKMFILPGYNGERIITRVIENGEKGAYKLHIGSIGDKAVWVENNGTLENDGEIDFYGSVNDGPDFSVIFDILAPEISIDSPTEGFYQSINLPTPIYSVVDNWDTNPQHHSFGWSNEEGSHTFSVQASDTAGNLDTKSVNYTVDNTPPEVIITSPYGGIYSSDSLPTLAYTVNDNFDSNPIVQVDGWSTSEGDHVVEVRATDKAGNIDIASVAYTIRNTLTDKDSCKNDKWQIFRLLDFKNQGQCVSSVEKNINSTKSLSLIQKIFRFTQ